MSALARMAACPAMLLLGAVSAGQATPYLDAVAVHAGRFLEHGGDHYGPRHTPLFVDGLDVRSLKPVEWVYGGSVGDPTVGGHNAFADRTQEPGERWILSNPASQADLFRVLDSLSDFTGDPRYWKRAEAALSHSMNQLSARSGLLYWGGHVAYDCASDSLVVEQASHELRCHFVPLELMEKVDRRRTRDFVEAFWHAHITDWRRLEMDRHGGQFFRKPPRVRTWPLRYRPSASPFEGKGRSFCHTATDLIAAAAYYGQDGGSVHALRWAERLGSRYADARHPRTGLGGRQYNIPSDDRARAQFGPEFGTIANDANILGPGMTQSRYARLPLCYLNVSEMLGEERGEVYRNWAVEDLLAFAEHAYDARHNRIYPMFVDGQRIDLSKVKRAGHYYDPENPARRTLLKTRSAEPIHLWAFARAFHLSQDKRLLPTLRAMGRAQGLGDLMKDPKLDHRRSDPALLHAMLELFRLYGDPQFLAMARQVGDNILRDRRLNGFLLLSSKHRFSRGSTPEALALLHLHDALQGNAGRVSMAWPTNPYFQCRYLGRGRMTDRDAIYKQKR